MEEHKIAGTPKEKFLNVINKIFVGDTAIWIFLFFILASSLVAIYSSSLSIAYAKGENFNHYLFKQMAIILVGFVVMAIVRFFPISFYKKHSKKIFIACVLLMLYTIFFGVEMNGARRWISIMGFTIQTSDFLKIGLVIYITKVLYDRQSNIKKIVFLPFKELRHYSQNKEYIKDVLIRDGFPLLFPPLICVAMIMKDNMSTSLVISLLILFVFILGGVSFREIKKMFLLGIVAVTLLVSFFAVSGSGRFETWSSRAVQFVTGTDNVFDEEGKVKDLSKMKNDDLQRLQSDIAIANGWLGGKGIGNSVQRSHLANSNSDFIYSFIIEEWSILGGIWIVCLFIWIFYRTIQIAKTCENLFSSMLCVNMGLLFTWSGISHILVCVGLFPVTGLTLPAISHGGTSILYTFIIIGIIQKISYEQRVLDKEKLLNQQENQITITEDTEN